jgi:hypothetical protein
VLRRDLFSTARCERSDITENLEPNDSKLRRDPADPTEKADRKDPTDPIDKAEPTLPIERIDPFEAIERTEFSDANDHLAGEDGFIVPDTNADHQHGVGHCRSIDLSEVSDGARRAREFASFRSSAGKG